MGLCAIHSLFISLIHISYPHHLSRLAIQHLLHAHHSIAEPLKRTFHARRISTLTSLNSFLLFKTKKSSRNFFSTAACPSVMKTTSALLYLLSSINRPACASGCMKSVPPEFRKNSAVSTAFCKICRSFTLLLRTLQFILHQFSLYELALELTLHQWMPKLDKFCRKHS